MKLVDSHCHLQDPAFDSDRGEVVARALSDLAWAVVVGDDVASSRAAVGMAGERLYASAGVHPHHASQFGTATLDEIEALVHQPCVVALGEIGLDYHYMYSPAPEQRRAFERQLGLAHEIGLPVIIHNRDAHEDLTAIIDAAGDQRPSGVMHCFSGDAAFAERCIEWGFYISFAGNVTYRNADNLREAAGAVAVERLLVETDSPYLVPHPLRGRVKRSEPGHVHHTAAFLAELRGIPLDQFARQTTANAARLFGVSEDETYADKQPGAHAH